MKMGNDGIRMRVVPLASRNQRSHFASMIAFELASHPVHLVELANEHSVQSWQCLDLCRHISTKGRG